MYNYLFVVITRGSELEGEEFFVQAKNYEEAKEIVKMYFSGEVCTCYGRYSDEEAEEMGIDTY